MTFETRRIRLGEWLILAAGILLAIDLIVAPWYGLNNVFGPTAATLGESTSATGWAALLVLGPIVLVICLAAVAVWWLQATQAAPAMPVVAAGLEFVASLLLVVALLIRVVFAPPSILISGAPGVRAIESEFGAYLGLALSLVLAAGCYLSLRRDGVAALDGPEQIELLQLTQRRRAS
jgi:hypothetical protein